MTGRALPARLPIPRAWSSPSSRNDSTPPCASPTRLTRPAGGACVSSPTLNSHTNAGRYLFATTDGHGGWSGWQIHCLASEDLTHWQDRGVVIDLHDQHLDGSGRTNILPGRTPTPGCRRSPFVTAAITCISAATGRPTWRYPTISMEDTLCRATWREPARTPRGTASEPASSRPASIPRRSATRRPADGT